MIVTISSEGFQELEHDDVAAVSASSTNAAPRAAASPGALAMSNYFYVAPEQLIRTGPSSPRRASPGVARSWPPSTTAASCWWRRTRRRRSSRSPRSTTASPSPGWASTTSSTAPRGRHPLGRPTGFTYSREDVDARALANYYAQHLGRHVHRGPKAARGRDPGRPAGQHDPPTKLYRIAYEGTITDEPRFRRPRGRRRDDQGPLRRLRGHTRDPRVTLKNAVALRGSGPHH
jgi:hypothetical protein